MVNFVVGLVVAVGTLTPKIGGTLSPAEQKWHLLRLLSDGNMKTSRRFPYRMCENHLHDSTK